MKAEIGVKGRIFGLVLLALLTIGIVIGLGAYNFWQNKKTAAVEQDINRISKVIMAAQLAEKAYTERFQDELKDEFLKQAGEVETELRGVTGEWGSEARTIGEKFAKYRALFDELSSTHVQYVQVKAHVNDPFRQGQDLMEGVIHEVEQIESARQIEGEGLTAAERELVGIARDCQIGVLKLSALADKFLVGGEESFLTEYRQFQTGNMRSYWVALDQTGHVANNAQFIKVAAALPKLMEQAQEMLDQCLRFYRTEKTVAKSLNDAGKDVLSETEALLRKVDASSAAKATVTIRIILVVIVAGIGAFLVASLLIALGIVKPLDRVIGGLSLSARKVASASGQVSAASHQLADGASEQAASIEETSSSLEEMASMTRHNAGNATQANTLMGETSKVVATASESMNHLTSSMTEISKSSEETSKIVKTIDEIAFQTNLLALNAAVEAARAGEAGAGFAVVADEVRNLAMRAAEAAKNTAGLIDETVKKIKAGSEIVRHTNGEFSKVAASASKMGDLIGEVAAASKEQSLGVEQINKAVAEMDRVVQQNAASAQESASASEDMRTQAEQMKVYVGELAAVLGGSATGSEDPSELEMGKGSRRVLTARSIQKRVGFSGHNGGAKGIAPYKGEEETMAPEEVIPFDEDD